MQEFNVTEFVYRFSALIMFLQEFADVAKWETHQI